MSVRYIADDQTIYKFDPELQTPNWLAENYPLQVRFYPSQKVIKDLINRMTQVKDPATDLWQAFQEVTSEFTGQTGWYPKMLIEPYEIAEEDE